MHCPDSRSWLRSPAAAFVVVALAASPAIAQQATPRTDADRPDSVPSWRQQQPEYPTPYSPASEDEIKAVLDRVLGYLEANTPAQLVDRETSREITDYSQIGEGAALARAPFRIISYEWGVTYSGMLLAGEVSGDARFNDYVNGRMSFIAEVAPRFRAQVEGDPRNFRNPFRAILAPRSLDDSGSMAAAMIKTHRAGLGGDLRPLIDNYLAYISTGQMRLADGTLARNRPLLDSLWLDDLYMSVPALAQMGKLTGERKYYDDAVKQILQFADRMFVKEKGLYMHGWVQGMNVHPVFHWGRANGWAILAKTELLEVLPENHPGRARVLDLLRAHIRGLAAVQGHAGLWHQLLDHPESYEETSCTAMFTFGIARAINRGWIDPLAHGPMASLGWNAVATRVNAEGQVENTCVGTGMGWDPMFYMYRPTSVYAAHGYGPVLLAGAEMIALRRGKGAVATVHDGGVHFGEALSPF